MHFVLIASSPLIVNYEWVRKIKHSCTMRVYFLMITKNGVSFSVTLRNIGSPWLKHIHVTDVSMYSGETNFIFVCV
jgi:hypothetical protein